MSVSRRAAIVLRNSGVGICVARQGEPKVTAGEKKSELIPFGLHGPEQDGRRTGLARRRSSVQKIGELAVTTQLLGATGPFLLDCRKGVVPRTTATTTPTVTERRWYPDHAVLAGAAERRPVSQV
jgi:hypothetical protein